MSDSNATFQKELLFILRQRLIPLARKKDSMPLILGETPLHVQPGIRVSRIPMPPLVRSTRGQNYFRMTGWFEERMDAGRFPFVAIVLSGEIDMRIASLAEPVTSPTGPYHSEGYLLTALTAGSALIFPPGAPHDSCQHYWREDIEQACSEILWIGILPEGMQCHMCVTRGTKHSYHGWILAHDPQVLTLSELLIGELRERSSNHDEIARALLLSVLLRLERSVGSRTLLPSRRDIHLKLRDTEHNSPTGHGQTDPTFQRAWQYIHHNLREDLSVTSIALHASVSPTQLNRVFRKETGTSVMSYVIGRRIEEACFFLEKSSLPIAEIGRLVGYPNPALFSNAFHRQMGVSPKSFREAKERKE
jgi:AraC-like DNA-binding protein